MTATAYYIASLKHTHKDHEHITFWGKDHRGYTMVFGDHMGKYTLDDARRLNSGISCIAVPVEAVSGLLSPEPYFRPHDPARFYDQRGPVIDNTRAMWNRLIAASLQEGREHKPKPEVFRGTRRSFALPASTEKATA
jgi:hypothetical protein